MKERIKKLRKALGLTQQEFADRIGISRGNIATYETRDGSPGSSVINLICREFNVNESWLRTGEGGDSAMFVQRSRDDELSAFVDELMKEQPQDFRRRLVTALSRLKPEQWDALESIALSLIDQPTPPTKLYIAARDGSRIETEVHGEITIPEEDDDVPE